eukprot:scaffold23169_cov54-Phaeocystis_antarctica.AAC.1
MHMPMQCNAHKQCIYSAAESREPWYKATLSILTAAESRKRGSATSTMMCSAPSSMEKGHLAVFICMGAWTHGACAHAMHAQPL